MPHGRHAKIEMASVSWNYTTVLNIVFLLVAALLLWRYFRRGGGWQMLRMMNKPSTSKACTAITAATMTAAPVRATAAGFEMPGAGLEPA